MCRVLCQNACYNTPVPSYIFCHFLCEIHAKEIELLLTPVASAVYV